MAASGPLFFQPVFKSYPWGGRNLATRFGRHLPDGVVAESWEISGHPNGTTPVSGGPFANRTLPELIAALGARLLGSRNRAAVRDANFPVLIKLLDAHEWLSVQVHPADDYALERHAEPGKTELWQVLHAEPGAELILGFRHPIEPAAFAAAIARGEVEEHLERVPVRAGEAYFLRPGTIHALGPGVIVAEIQQSSDLTFRIFDWGRVDAAGQARTLHVEEALRVLDYSAIAPGPAAAAPPSTGPAAAPLGETIVETLAACPHFVVERVLLPAGAAYEGSCDGETYEIWGVVKGSAGLSSPGAEPCELDAVAWTLLPADLGPYALRAHSSDEGAALLLRIYSPEPG
jgi:mannose-6-phosphate isomerase